VKFPIAAIACLALASCATINQPPANAAGPVVFNASQLRTDFEKKMGELIKAGEHTPHATLKEQLGRKSCQLELPKPGSRQLSPADIYRQRLGSTLMLGKLNHCKSSKCTKAHANIASGVVIREDGIVLTNYHVVDSEQPKLLGMGAMTHDGRAFLVEEVLAADKDADVAILKLRDAEGLTAAPVFRDEPVGNPATIISNPIGKFFTLTHGMVSRYHDTGNGTCMMNVTADYAKGSSGGPIFNDRGDVIGLVSNTVSIAYNQMPVSIDSESKSLTPAKGGKPAMINGRPLIMDMNHQMTLKNAVASRSILALIEA